jgi:hypothetical protein
VPHPIDFRNGGVFAALDPQHSLASSTMSDRKLFGELALHLLMGAALGAILAILLLAVDAQHLLKIIRHGSAPMLTLIVFVAFISMYFAFGAAITGFHFVIMEDRPDRK